jgi:hypothetical protein
MGLVAGVVVLNALLAVVGYCILAPALRGRSALTWVSYGGVALLVGAGLVPLVLEMLAPTGLHIGLPAFAVVAAVLAVAGVAASRFVRLDADPRPARPPRTLTGDVVVTAAAFGIVAILGIGLVGGFRASPWLDDTWYFWLPKGRALDLVGLDPRLWTPQPALHMIFGHDYESLTFIRPDNPLWWSILLNLDMRFVGSVDLRAVNGELAFLMIGFVGAAARLLWGHVRSSILLPALLVLLSAPEFLRQAQGGDADVPLAIYLALAILCAAGWLALRSRFALALFTVLAAAAVAIKAEGVLELGLDLAIVSVAGWRVRRALLPLWGAAVAAVATGIPWYAWRAANDVSNVFSLRNALSPSYLRHHTDLLHGGLRTLGDHLTSVREWSLIVPLAIVLGLLGFARERRLAWLAPAAFLGFGYVFFVWISWADPEGAFRLVASAYRYVTPPIVLAGIFLPLLGERLLRRLSGQPTDRPVVSDGRTGEARAP